MAPPIDLGLSYEQAEEQSKFELIPDGTYEFSVDSCEDRIYESGRPALNWKLRLEDAGEFTGRTVFYSTPRPWINPEHPGEVDNSMIALLLNLCKAVRMTWRGTQLPEKESFYGMRGTCKIGHKPRKNDPETIDNTVKMVVPK